MLHLAASAHIAYRPGAATGAGWGFSLAVVKLQVREMLMPFAVNAWMVDV